MLELQQIHKRYSKNGKDIQALEKIASYDSGHIGNKRTPPDTERQLVDIEVERSAHRIARIR